MAANHSPNEAPAPANPNPHGAPVAADPKPSEAAAANRIAMHPVTGTFADPADEERLLYEVQSVEARATL